MKDDNDIKKMPLYEKRKRLNLTIEDVCLQILESDDIALIDKLKIICLLREGN